MGERAPLLREIPIPQYDSRDVVVVRSRIVFLRKTLTKSRREKDVAPLAKFPPIVSSCAPRDVCVSFHVCSQTFGDFILFFPFRYGLSRRVLLFLAACSNHGNKSKPFGGKKRETSPRPVQSLLFPSTHSAPFPLFHRNRMDGYCIPVCIVEDAMMNKRDGRR